jgi:hypothetical protein
VDVVGRPGVDQPLQQAWEGLETYPAKDDQPKPQPDQEPILRQDSSTLIEKKVDSFEGHRQGISFRLPNMIAYNHIVQ